MTVQEGVGVTNRTKIVGTLGPACASKQVLREMIAAGMDVARMNFSHGSADRNLELLALVREAAKERNVPLAVMQDLQGPKLRIGELPEGGVKLLETSTTVLRAGADQFENDELPVPFQHFHKDIAEGDRILLGDGQLELEVLSVSGRTVTAKVLLGGVLRSRQGLTIPSRRLSIESFTEKDEQDLMLGLQHQVDFVAMSYVKTADDVVQLGAKISEFAEADSNVPQIIVKIEKYEAVENFDAILKEADAVMLARGDLGLDTSISAVPVTQKEITAKCLVAGKPVIVATQMLSSMTVRPRPTRAEASDVANAVIDHADAVMLSEETAMGRFPVRSVSTMTDIIAKTEESPLDNLIPDAASRGEPLPLSVAASAVSLARQASAQALLVTTHSGFSARAVARFRPEIPLFAATDDPLVQRQLSLSWGVIPLYVEGYEEPERMVEAALEKVAERVGGGRAIVVSGLSNASGYDSAVRVVDL